MNPFRALITNDGYAATFQSLGQYRTALLNAWPSFIDLENLADELLSPREIRRDANGHLQHPAMPSLGENVCIAEFLSAFGLECDAVAMEDDDRVAWDRYTEAENTDCSFWNPSMPAGDGWVLLEIFESEDGPSALYARRKPELPRYSRRAHPSPFAAKVTRIKRRSGELVVQLGHQAPDRMYAGTSITLHWRTDTTAADDDTDPTTKAQYRRMFQAACSDLGLINEKLGLDPNDGGAEPILAAIDELLATSTAAGQGDLVAAVRAMLTMLDSGEWAEHAAATTGRGNPLAQRLEDAITDLHNETHDGNPVERIDAEFKAAKASADSRAVDVLVDALGCTIGEHGFAISAMDTCVDDERDAARYRWLREQHWNKADMAVVCYPKKSVKLGFDCPSGQRLDEAIDTAMSASKEGAA